MKKIVYHSFIFFFAFIIAFVSFPFYSFAQSSNNSIVNPWDNTIDFLRCQLGVLNAEAGSIAGVSRLDFYRLLYDLPLIYNGSQFTPSSIFTSSEWVNACNSSSATVNGKTFNILDCLAESNILVPNPSGDYTVSPDLLLREHGGSSGSFNSASPIDGVEVKTNFSDYSPNYGTQSSYNSQFINNLKSEYLSLSDRLLIVCGNSSTYNDSPYFCFFSLKDTCDFIGIYKDSNNKLKYTYHLSSGWTAGENRIIGYRVQYANYGNSYYMYYPYGNFNSIVSPSFYDSSLTIKSQTFGNLSDITSNVTYWSSFPLVIGSDSNVIQNYYYWLKGSPSGYYYTTTNVSNTVFSSEYVNNTNWEQTYNNYVTDVSNYYSTTENITNEQLSQYIDNSTTITNITNNYITNNNGGGGDDIITNSWLERIYNLLLDFYFAFIGQPSSGSSDNNNFYTDNSIKNDIVDYPLSEFFPDVPSEYFIPENETFSIPLFNQKTARVLQTAMPFCYLEKLKYIASFLSTPPQTPHYEIPFVIDSFGIDETVSISFEDNAWSVLHGVWIALFMIIFIIALFYFTYRFILLVSSILG